MFQAELVFEDLTSPLDLIEGGFSLGRSWILPVQHRLVRTAVLESRERIAIITCERFADDPDALEVHAGISDAEFRAKLNELEDHPLDFAVLLVDRRRRTIHYRASPIISIPAYLLADACKVSIDWDYSRLLGDLPTQIVWDVALAQIAGLSSYGPRTVVAGLWRATAGATLIAGSTGVEVELPEAVVHDGPHELVPHADIEAKLYAVTTALLEVRPLDRCRTAVELSGGMDSGLTALAAASVTGPGLMSIGAQFNGAMGEAQRTRRRLLRERGGFDDFVIPAERFAPFSPASLRRRRYGVWPEDENYPEMFEAMFGMLQKAGIDSLISGFGGDELYIAYEGEANTRGEEGSVACPFLSERGLQIAGAAITPYPRGWLQQSCWQSAASQSQRILRYGLWPIYPYHNVALARFISRLPYAYRRDRQLLRQTLTRVLGDSVFQSDYVKETFDPVAWRGITENRDYLIDLVQRSSLSRHPEIDDAAIVTALRQDTSTLDRETFNALFRVLKLFCFFQSGDDVCTMAYDQPAVWAGMV